MTLTLDDWDAILCPPPSTAVTPAAALDERALALVYKARYQREALHLDGVNRAAAREARFAAEAAVDIAAEAEARAIFLGAVRL